MACLWHLMFGRFHGNLEAFASFSPERVGDGFFTAPNALVAVALTCHVMVKHVIWVGRIVLSPTERLGVSAR